MFKLSPEKSQLVYNGDSLPIDCMVASDSAAVSLFWMRRGQRVSENKTVGIFLDSRVTEPGVLTLTLR